MLEQNQNERWKGKVKNGEVRLFLVHLFYVWVGGIPLCYGSSVISVSFIFQIILSKDKVVAASS